MWTTSGRSYCTALVTGDIATLAATGFALGWSVAWPPGPINAEMIRRGLSRGFWPAYAVGLGASTADFFWAPLLGLYTGARLGRIVTLKMVDIGQHAETGIWYLDVKPKRAKTKNLIRRLPIPARLMELGLVEHVEHLQMLGATLFFPHYDFSNPNERPSGAMRWTPQSPTSLGAASPS